jgi:hypothetical protein
MKNVIVSADGDRMVYSVPSAVADNLEKYCLEFIGNWIWTGPLAQKYRKGNGVCYNEKDFIEYLNSWLFPNEQSALIENLGPTGIDAPPIPERYSSCPRYNF